MDVDKTWGKSSWGLGVGGRDFFPRTFGLKVFEGLGLDQDLVPGGVRTGPKSPYLTALRAVLHASREAVRAVLDASRENKVDASARSTRISG